MWLPSILTGVLFAWAGWIADHEPTALSGYALLPAKRREKVDIRALGHYCARLLYLCAALSFCSLALLFLPQCENAMALATVLPIPVLLAGWVWGWIRYDRKFRNE